MKNLLYGIMTLFVITGNCYAISIVNFSGQLTRIFEYDSNTGTVEYFNQSNRFGNSFAINDVFTGHFAYNITTTPVSHSSTFAVYNHNTVVGMKININDYLFSSYGSTEKNGYVQIQNDNVMAGNDKDAFSISDRYDSNSITHDAELSFFDATATVYNSLSIPAGINLDNFTEIMFHQSLRDKNNNQLHLYGTVDSVSMGSVSFDAASKGNNPVPEPATFLLFGVGLLSLTGIIRRKEQHFFLELQ